MTQIGSGILKRHKGKALLLSPEISLYHSNEGILVPESLVRKYQLVEGAAISGKVRKDRQGLSMLYIDTVCGGPPDNFRKRQPYQRLTAITPEERFKISVTGEPAMRVVDMLAPIAKGTRGLIVSPPKAGKTILLEQFATAIKACSPETRLIALLVDERPEEVTHFRRNVPADVYASSNDRPVHEHIELTEMVMKHVVTELEFHKDVVVLVDSITRMARAFNSKSGGKQKGRVLSGGLQFGAMEIPRRFFGMARCIEGGGSLTILATVLVDTGSRMDQLIFEEFKGTGNNEIVLNRELAEARVFPAIDLMASGTRREELLYSAPHMKQITKLRRALTKVKTREGMELLLKFLGKYPTNEDFLNEVS